MTKIDYYCGRCHTQLERYPRVEVKNAFRNYVVYHNWCPKCERWINNICRYGGYENAPKDECILDDAGSCIEGEDGVLYWKCPDYIKEHILSKDELEAGIV